MERLLAWQRCVAAVFGVFLCLMTPRAFCSVDGVVPSSSINIPLGMSAHFVKDADDVAVINFTGNMDANNSDGTTNNAARAGSVHNSVSPL